jgi:hypothetical protein
MHADYLHVVTTKSKRHDHQERTQRPVHNSPPTTRRARSRATLHHAAITADLSPTSTEQDHTAKNQPHRVANTLSPSSTETTSSVDEPYKEIPHEEALPLNPPSVFHLTYRTDDNTTTRTCRRATPHVLPASAPPPHTSWSPPKTNQRPPQPRLTFLPAPKSPTVFHHHPCPNFF